MTGETDERGRDVIEFRSKGAIREPDDYDETNSRTRNRERARDVSHVGN